MTVKTAKISGRRTLHFQSLDDVVSDAEKMIAKPHRTLGNWNTAQILEHVAIGMDMAFDGATFKVPWVVRTFIAPLVKTSFLTKPMSAGFQLPKSATDLIPPSNSDETAALDKLRRAVNRFKTETPDKPHVFLGKLTPEQSVQLHLRHSELHLSFIVPDN